ncbi:MAG: XdhC/CoxI family protein [Alphaproteobacteria bacterium]|jgi:xanthine dehydrogenase accessory factor|nr:XdhC/CoxI family protein [Alphaproteobacteria bacterium]
MTEPVHRDADPLDRAAAWRAAGRHVALATVVETWGSSPRPAGSLMAVDEEGRMAGSVSGGCIEGDVVRQARDVMVEGAARLLTYGVSSARAWEVGLPCGGRVQVRLEALAADDPILAAVLEARTARQPVVLLTALDGGARVLVAPDGSRRAGSWDPPAEALAAAGPARRNDVCRTVDSESGRVLVQPFNPPLRLIIVGAVHIAQILAPMAGLAGYDVTIVDPRRAFATDERFPAVRLAADDWPDTALEALQPDARTAIVTLTHDAKLDDPALEQALASDAFYIAALGSTGTSAKRRARLAERGHAPDAIARVHGPAGLPIGSVTPAEIALSILAQMTAVLRTRS